MTDPKNYKSQEDPERAFYLISACNIMRDFPSTTALAASFIKELHAMNLRQQESDQKEAQAAAKAKVAVAEISESDTPHRSSRASR